MLRYSYTVSVAGASALSSTGRWRRGHNAVYNWLAIGSGAKGAAMPDKFEREIDEILSKLDKFPNRSSRKRRPSAFAVRLAAMQRGLVIRLSRLSINQVMLAGIGLILFGFFFRAAMPEFWFYVVTFGLILFFTVFVLSFFGFGARSSRGNATYWRGRPVQSYYASEPSLASRLRELWRRRRGQR
jgi:hypothetical protein